MMNNRTKLPTLIVVSVATIFLVGSVALAGLLFVSSNSRDGQDPARQEEMMALVLKWGRLSPFPASATNVSVKTEGGSFTRGFRASFAAPKQDIQSWIGDSPGLNEAAPDELSDDRLQYIVAPGGGASKAEVTIDYGVNQVEIYVSWG